MVFGNMGESSATGVCFSRDAATGEDLFNGGIYDFLQKKKIESLNELQLSASPTVSATKKEEPETVSENILRTMLKKVK